MVERFTDDPGAGDGTSTLSRELLLTRLRQWPDLEDCPLDAILAQGQACGDTTPPAPEEIALLRWLGAAHRQWEHDFPLEAELTQHLRRLKPLLAALAVYDPLFLVPGQHPLHALLDSIQAAAIGWQASLGRAAQGLERQIEESIEKALAWFDRPETDLGAITAALESKLNRDAERAQKMARRVVEMELGRQKKAEVANLAAKMINAALEKFEAPANIGELLKGPWYDSAQLALLKFGEESEEWAQMSKATDTLLDSVQVFETEPENRRQQLFRVVTLLPKELRRRLLSLHHDSGAVDDAVGVVEFAHLCVLRQRPLETEVVSPLPLLEGTTAGEEGTKAETNGAKEGQWYLITREGEAPLRARIIFDSTREQQLIFANRMGMEVLRLGREEFSRLLQGGSTTPLQRGASYSRSLAAAAGITSEADLEGLPGAAELSPETGSPAPPELSSEEEEQARLWQEWEEARARQLGAQPEEYTASPGK